MTTPAETMRQKLREWGVTQRIDVVPNATDLAPFLSADGSPVRRQYGIGDDDVLLLWAGRLAPEKNIPFLIESVGLINESAPNTKLMIVGSGPDAEALRRLAADRGLSDCIILTGHVPYASIPPYYAAADIFVSASVTEVQPLVITEAMAAHTPVVAVQAQGSVDAIRHGENGLLASVCKSDLASKTLELVRDAERRRRMGAKAREFSNRYAVPKMARRLVEVYESVLAVHRDAPREIAYSHPK